MDRISVLGLFIGLSAIVGGQVLEGGHVSSLLQPTAFLIVVGGTVGAVLLQSPKAVFMRGMRMFRWVWMPPVVNQAQLITLLTNWGQTARREGLLALEGQIGPQKDTFIKKGVQLLVDGCEPELSRSSIREHVSTSGPTMVGCVPPACETAMAI